MGARQKNRVAPPKPDTITPDPVDIHDEHYRGKHPDDINYPHRAVVDNPAYPGQQVEIKAFSLRRLAELQTLASDYLFPLLEENGLKVGTLAEKRSGGGKPGTSKTLGACWHARFSPTFGEDRQSIILDEPSTHSRVLYTLIHECGHLKEMNHGPKFKQAFGEMLDWAIEEGTPYTTFERRRLIAHAKGDRYAPPTPPRGRTWDDYGDRASSTFEVAEPIAKSVVAAAELGDEESATLWDLATGEAFYYAGREVDDI